MMTKETSISKAALQSKTRQKTLFKSLALSVSAVDEK
jgi:hypothetical protein